MLPQLMTQGKVIWSLYIGAINSMTSEEYRHATDRRFSASTNREYESVEGSEVWREHLQTEVRHGV
jgi:hypothetical protein